MDSRPPLENLLQTLVNSPEEDKRSLTRSAIGLLREVCSMHLSSNYSKFQDIAGKAREVLDQILVGKIETEEEEEFLESGVLAISEGQSPRPSPEIIVEEEDSLHRLLREWNEKKEPWLQIPFPEGEDSHKIIKLVKNISGVYSNIYSASKHSKAAKADLNEFEEQWQKIQEEISQLGYETFPNQLGKVAKPVGEIIYSCRPRLSSIENIIVVPGIKKQEETLLSPLTLVSFPVQESFPPNHPDKDLSPHWRGILGMAEILLRQLEIQHSVVSAVESVNKIDIEPFSYCREPLFQEAKRRIKALRRAVTKDQGIYRLATNYWRVEECFWGIFHDDGRPRGYSVFDRIRRHVQVWRTTIRKESKIYIRDFNSGRDSLGSIHKYIGNIILRSKQGLSPGIVLRELRPAILVKVNNATRLLRGRVIAT